jgi:hypothetical protein
LEKAEGADCIDVEVIERARGGEGVAQLGEEPFKYRCNCLRLRPLKKEIFWQVKGFKATL